MSQFQFSKISPNLKTGFEDKIEWDCNGTNTRLNMGGGFGPMELNETCVYSSGIKTSRLEGYEYANNTISYPRSGFTFEEVANYHLGKRHFYELSQIGYKQGTYAVDGLKISFESKSISIDSDGGHGWESIKIVDDFIVYEVGGGA